MNTLETLKKGIKLFKRINTLVGEGVLPGDFEHLDLNEYVYFVKTILGIDMDDAYIAYELETLEKLVYTLNKKYVYVDIAEHNDLDILQAAFFEHDEMHNFLELNSVHISSWSTTLFVNKDAYNNLDIKY